MNYSNRNASVGVSNEQLFTAYIAEVLLLPLAAIRLFQVAPLFPVYKIIIIVASHYYSFNDLFFVELLTIKGGLVGRLVPLVAVAAANCVNIPLMRQQELKNGIAIETKDGVTVGSSSNAAITAALMQVVPSRVGMAHPVAAPAIFIPPVVMMSELLGKDKDFRQEPVAEGTGHSTSDGHVFDLLYSTLLRALPSEEDEQLVSRLALLVNK